MCKKRQKNDEKELDLILKMSSIGALSALGIVLSFVVVFIPNVEFISFTMFLIVILFGIKYGLIATVAIATVYEILVTSVYGSSGLLFIIKLICYILMVIIVGLARKKMMNLSWWEYGVIGATFAIFYDVTVTIAGISLIFQEALSLEYITILVILGVPFTIIHVVGNFLIFSSLKKIIQWIKNAYQYKGIKFFYLLEEFECNDDSSN